MAAPVNCEYTYLNFPTGDLDWFATRMTELASVGWRVVGFAGVDPRLGLNAYTAVLERQTTAYPGPSSEDAGWHTDPAGRHERRYWNGFRWSEYVVDGEKRAIDWPIVQ
jgi:hypothetical protein